LPTGDICIVVQLVFLAAMFVMNQHQSNNTKKTYMASWLKISINCQDVKFMLFTIGYCL